MEVHLNNPDLQAKVDRWVAETGRRPDELVEDAMVGYFEELTRTRDILSSRYDDLKSGRVKPIDGEEAFARLKAKTEVQRNRPTWAAGSPCTPRPSRISTTYVTTSPRTVRTQLTE